MISNDIKITDGFLNKIQRYGLLFSQYIIKKEKEGRKEGRIGENEIEEKDNGIKGKKMEETETN